MIQWQCPCGEWVDAQYLMHVHADPKLFLKQAIGNLLPGKISHTRNYYDGLERVVAERVPECATRDSADVV